MQGKGNVKVIRTVEDFGLKSRPYVRNYGLKVGDILSSYFQLYEEVIVSNGNLRIDFAGQSLDTLNIMRRKLAGGIALCLELVEYKQITFSITYYADALEITNSLTVSRKDESARHIVLALYYLEVLKELEVYRCIQYLRI